jgi:hypothetical protein
MSSSESGLPATRGRAEKFAVALGVLTAEEYQQFAPVDRAQIDEGIREYVTKYGAPRLRSDRETLRHAIFLAY